MPGLVLGCVATPENQSRGAGETLILNNMFRFAVSLAPAVAGALSAARARAHALPGGQRG